MEKFADSQNLRNCTLLKPQTLSKICAKNTVCRITRQLWSHVDEKHITTPLLMTWKNASFNTSHSYWKSYTPSWSLRSCTKKLYWWKVECSPPSVTVLWGIVWCFWHFTGVYFKLRTNFKLVLWREYCLNRIPWYQKG